MHEDLLKAVGLNEETLQQRVIDACCDRLLTSVFYDDDGEFHSTSPMARRLSEQIRQRVNDRIDAIAQEHVFPKVDEIVANITLQATNKWGEKQGEPLTFTEYLVHRAEAYLREQVDYNGKGKDEAGGYSWSGKQTRITYLVHAHLQYSIEEAMKKAVKNANSVIVEGIAETVKMKLAEVSKSLSVTVNTGR